MAGHILPNKSVPSSSATCGLLDTFHNNDGKVWMYVKAGEAIAANDVVAVDQAGTAMKLTKTLADKGHQPAVASVAFTNAYYGMVQIAGAVSFKALANCAANVKLYTSATAGSVDDDATSQTLIQGLYLDTAVGGSAAVSTGWMQRGAKTF